MYCLGILRIINIFKTSRTFPASVTPNLHYVQVKEPDYNSMVTAGKVKYMPPRFMTVICTSVCIISTFLLYVI